MVKFTFPVPGRRSKQAAEPAASAIPLTKAQKILGTGGINTGSTAAARGVTPKQPWDARSGISISISESSASHTVTETGLEVLHEEGGFTNGMNYGGRGWDTESEVLPRHLQAGNGLRTQRSAATIGNDYRTDASSLQRRQSNASTIYSHYDRSKVPLSISQQTSNSAMAKGLPNSKANALLDMDGSISGPTGKKKKPSRLDLSMLRPRNRRERASQAAPVLGNDYVTRSPSFVSLSSTQITPGRKLRKSPSTISTGTYDSPSGPHDSTTLSQLYDHYEAMSFRSQSSPAEENMARPRFDSVSEEPEPTPALTTSSTISQVTPLSNPTAHESSRRTGHSRKDSVGSRNTVTTVGSPSIAPSSYLAPGGDCASSISSRNTRGSKTSKNSRKMDSDLQLTSVLSLSDSDSDDGTTFSDSVGPKSSVSSHSNISQDDASLSGDVRKPTTTTRSPVVQERSSSRQKHTSFTPLNDYLTVPAASTKTHSTRKPSESTLRSYASSTSTATATAHSQSQPGKGSRLSTSSKDSKGTSSSHHSQTSHKKRQQSRPIAQEAKAVTLKPLASTAEALDSLRELTAQAQAKDRRTLSSEELTPPLSPASLASYGHDYGGDETGEARNARLMAVTKQEEMLLAALRQKRAMMRENIIAEIEGDKASVTSRRTSTSSGRSGKAGRVMSSAPQLPPLPSRDSSLVSSFKSITERKDSVRRTDNNVRFADEPQSNTHNNPIEKRSSSAMSNATIKGNSHGRTERVLMFLDRPLEDFHAIDVAEPSPDLSEFMDYDQDSDGEILPDRRSSRRSSRFNSTYGTSTPASRRGGERPRADSNLLGVRGSSLRRQLEKLPESSYESNEEEDFDFDGFSDVMCPPLSDEDTTNFATTRTNTPVQYKQHSKGHVKGKNSAVRLSAVGNFGSFMPPEVGLWGDDG
ncbi:hypothetical protein TruAng_009852 [Truncatella angustata]|nr:hypothetical protein TruAng_009852 [Truncatella angustata]